MWPTAHYEPISRHVSIWKRSEISLRKTDNTCNCLETTALQMDLHWLRVPQRIQYKLSVLMYCRLNGAAPRYLTELATPIGGTARRRLRSARHLPISSYQLCVDQQSAIAHSPLLTREHGTVYLLLSAPLPHTTSSKKTLNLIFLDYPSHCDNCVLWLCTALL